MVNIKRIRIEGFRSLDNVDLELDGGAFITGMNGAGKSSVLEAIRFALLGYCQNTDRRGAGAKALIAHGAKEASIAIELLGGRDMTAALVRVVISQEGAVRWNAEDAETGIALVDDLDHLDGKNRNQALSNIAHDVREGHSIQVIAAGAWGKASEPDPDTLAAIGRALEPLQPVWVCADSLKEEQEAVA